LKKILGAVIGSDVHVAGLLNFLNLAEDEGFETVYLGGRVSIRELVSGILKHDPDIVAISYRLGTEPLKKLLDKLIEEIEKHKIKDKEFIFGGTMETAGIARKYPIFSRIFDGSEGSEGVVAYLKGFKESKDKEIPPQTLPERVEYMKPHPLIRHHIGLPSLTDTVKEIEKLADSGLLDIISIAPDQNCQQFFFEPEKIDPRQNGAGGAPIRSIEDFKKLYEASRRGNYPLVRCYAGTKHLVSFSRILKETLNNAWAAIPIFWYSELDRRSDRPLLEAIKENLEAIRWNAENGVPVEVNDAHQWELRYAHDSLAVAVTYIAAYVAKHLGVKHYVQQYMIDNPPGMSPKMDMAKLLAKKELVESLEDNSFKVYRMIRTGLLSFPADPNAAKGQLAATMFYASFIEPHIIHVAAYCEALYRATSKEIIESVKIVKRACALARRGMPEPTEDPEIMARVKILKEEALEIVEAIKALGYSDEPLLDPEILYKAVETGILDAPALRGMSVAKGLVNTRIVEGACVVVDETGKIMKEKERLEGLKW